MRRALLLASTLLFAGCLEAIIEGDDGPACAPLGQTLISFPIETPTASYPDQAWDMLYLVGNASIPTAYAFHAPADWAAEIHAFFGDDQNDSHLLHVRAEPGNRSPAGGAMLLEWRERPADPRCSGAQGYANSGISSPVVGDRVQVGHGALVMTAGFLPNGTLFYTNMQEMNALSEWPAISWYTWEGSDPLPVYVYDQDRSERPQEWNATVPTPQGETVAWSYFTTIKGFNEALKGLSVNTPRVVYINATDAYTQPGREDHVLYGHDLVFYIQVLEAVQEPWCPELPSFLPCVARP